MSLKSELNRLRSEMAARKLQYPKGFWTWTPCPPGSNLGYYEHKGEYAMAPPVGGKGIKIQYATVDSADARAKDFVEGETLYPTADDWRHFAAHAPADLIEPYGLDRKELAEALPILWRATINKHEPSEDILSDLMPSFKLASKAEQAAAIKALDTKRGKLPKRSLRKKVVEVAEKVIEPFVSELPSALELVVAEQEKAKKQEKPVDVRQEMLDRRYGVEAAKKQAAKRKRAKDREAGMDNIDKAFASDAGWTNW